MLVQASLPLNPEHLLNAPVALAFNTAISFATNANWLAYSEESTMSYLTQICGLGAATFVCCSSRGDSRQSLIHPTRGKLLFDRIYAYHRWRLNLSVRKKPGGYKKMSYITKKMAYLLG